MRCYGDYSDVESYFGLGGFITRAQNGLVLEEQAPYISGRGYRVSSEG